MSSVFNSVLQVEKSSSLQERNRETDSELLFAPVQAHTDVIDCISPCSPDTIDKSVCILTRSALMYHFLCTGSFIPTTLMEIHMFNLVLICQEHDVLPCQQPEV